MAIVSLALLAGTPTWGRSPFDGTWLADLGTQSGLATDDYLVAGGRYACRSCEPPRGYAADGRPHAVPGAPDTVSESVAVTGPRTIVTHIVDRDLDRTTTMTVAVDDRTATYVSLDHRPGIAGTLRTVYLARRTAPAPPGTHPVSGRWQGIRYVEVPAAVRTVTLHVDGDRFRYATPLGTRYAATLGGRGALVHRIGGGDAGGATVAVRRIGPRTIEERSTRGGRLVAVRRFIVAPDGRSLSIATTDPASGATFRATSHHVAAQDGSSAAR